MPRKKQNGYHIQNGALKYNIWTLVILLVYCFKMLQVILKLTVNLETNYF